MKRTAFILLCFAFCSMLAGTVAAQKTKISDGVYIVNYAGTYVIEDEKNQQSISLEIKQERVDDQNDELMFNVVCGKYTKRVAKFALKTAVAAGVKAAAASYGASLVVSAAAEVATWIYDDFCDNWEKKRNK